MTDEQTGGPYYGRGFDTPLLTGDEPDTARPSSPQFSDAEAALRDGENADAYVERLTATASKRDAVEPERRSLTVVADERWIDGTARRALAAQGVSRPTQAQYRRAVVEAAALLSRARSSK
jgi:hypothetical protein